MSRRLRSRSRWERGIESDFPETEIKREKERGAIRGRRQLFLSSIFHSSFRSFFFFIGCLSHADPTAVLYTAARTAFPATRPAAQRRTQ